MDWDDDQGKQELMPEVEVEKVSLRDFIVPAKVSAFVKGYVPCSEGDDGYEMFERVVQGVCVFARRPAQSVCR